MWPFADPTAVWFDTARHSTCWEGSSQGISSILPHTVSDNYKKSLKNRVVQTEAVYLGKFNHTLLCKALLVAFKLEQKSKS